MIHEAVLGVGDPPAHETGRRREPRCGAAIRDRRCSLWRRLSLGPDSGKRTLSKLEQIRKNVESLEPVWSSTEMDPDRVDAFFEGR
ncbi:hypothetical protein BD626DRAFT_508228 [Schizophyllum amplum]|uniref:Uncharacterized protein n=1 Tax=Schizophyllum amplum TaxID=97359 RepID=A0A550C3N6_9AGAR|nr:hypothetical protein BD626DRAFT_508228 [Auriculariopsis ampla]